MKRIGKNININIGKFKIIDVVKKQKNEMENSANCTIFLD